MPNTPCQHNSTTCQASPIYLRTPSHRTKNRPPTPPPHSPSSQHSAQSIDHPNPVHHFNAIYTTFTHENYRGLQFRPYTHLPHKHPSTYASPYPRIYSTTSTSISLSGPTTPHTISMYAPTSASHSYNSSKDWISNNMEVKTLGPVHNMSAAAVAGAY